MTDSATDDEKSRLRALVPLHTLPETALETLLDEVSFETLGKGKLLFEQGDTSHEHIYLIDGVVALLEAGRVADTVRAGTDTARFPLAHQIPRRHSARAEGKVRIARLDSRRLSDALARTQTVDYQVSDLGEAGDDDWMGMLLQSRILQQVPAANIQRVMMSVEQVEVGAGEDLVRQGDPGDFYYMLTAGRAAVLRDSGDGRGAVELATLGPGDAFGEEALLSDNPRNSTVTMLEDGAVLRLGKDHFLDLIHSPLLDRVDMAVAQAKVEQGALWLDVRSSEQFDESHLPGAINCPFESLRYQSASLSPDHHYVLYSNTGGRAMASAFLLTERGFQVSVLEGGLRAADGSGGGSTGSEISAAPPPAVDDDVVRARLREAEERATELEHRLREAEQFNQDAESERQRQLEQVRSTIDQARRKLVETEEQKREALEAQQQAYAEMERLTSSLEQVESERASLQDRMAEIEGLDKQLQARLIKAERELIGASERAESATSSMEELSDRLSEILEQREQERARHALERGELKEEMTALQLDLEQAQQDLEELREHLNRREAGDGDAEQRLAELSDALARSTREQEGLAAERDRLQAGLDELHAAQGELQQRLGALEDQVAGHVARNQELEQELGAARARVTELESAPADAGRTADASAAQADPEGASNDGSARIAELEQRLADSAEALEEARQALTRKGEDAASVRQRQAELEAENATLAAELGQVREELAQQVEAAIAESEQQFAWQNERDALQRELSEARAEVARQLDTARALDQQLGELRRSIEAGQQAETAAATGAEEALRTEMQSLAQRIEERELALVAARSEQVELIEALDLANTERESLQITLNRHEEALARVAELENELLESQRAHEGTRQRLQALTLGVESGQPGAAAASHEEVAQLRETLAAREVEVAQLRGVIEEHVDRIRSGHDEDSLSELEALRAELAMVREQATRDAAQMREQLAAAEMQKLRLHQADEREAISHEAMRQRIESLESSLAERQRELAAAEEARHMLEDALEDANRQLDGTRLEHERALQDADAAVASRREAEQARDQLKAALERLQENAELVSATDLRDARLSSPKTPLGIDSLGTRRRWPAALIGFLLGGGGMVAWVVQSGNGRIFDPLRSWLGL